MYIPTFHYEVEINSRILEIIPDETVCITPYCEVFTFTFLQMVANNFICLHFKLLHSSFTQRFVALGNTL